ncbi:efflux transporter [Saccharicrinis fermentans DSM 9555 = JCM 21142]|uniref:Efflux transporter n=1 Tax=Saccharicrinis fermentans DSM 9555 = JCM 21142 TaxID=869213 RepID=W7Y8M2_9BACT|nr:efflux transporter [Saccharicrinis fermentans DSM 9555 = JCM 21142]
MTQAVSYSEELLNNGYQNTTYLEVLTARSNALSSEISTIDSKFQQLNAIVELYLALGGGWK